MAVSTVSYTKTPQAQDDLFASGEDSGYVQLLDVMADDLGGNAKSLYSLDDGSAASDLLARDAVGAVQYSSKGAVITIGADGKVHYDASSAAADIQALHAGETWTDTFFYAIQLGNGTLSWATAEVVFRGANDIASIGGDTAGAVTEDEALVASGTLVVSDADHDESYAQEGSGEAALGSYAVSATGEWTYAVDNAAIQHLGAGKTASDSFVVTSLDGTASQTVTITITGVNDIASITGDLAGAATEDGPLGASGTLLVADADDDESYAQEDSGDAALGSYTVLATGEWTYTVDNAAIQHLGAGAQTSDSFTVTSLDGTAAQSVTIVIEGVNDAAALGGAFSGSVTEDGTLAAGGAVTVSDVDDGEAFAAAASSLAGTYGDFTFDGSSGGWTYTLRNGDAAVQGLDTGEERTDTLGVASLDGTALGNIVVTIHGATDSVPPPAPLLSGDPNDNDAFTGGVTRGTQGNDTLQGTSGNDSGLNGLGGGDTIYGLAGNDAINGNNQGDTVYGGSGQDTIGGGNDNDILYGGSGNDAIAGDGGTDALVGGYGDDALSGGTGNDVFRFTSMNDRTDAISDWNAGDKIDLSALLGELGAPHDGSVFGDYVALEADGAAGTNVMIDMDGNDGFVSAVLLVQVTGAVLAQTDFIL